MQGIYEFFTSVADFLSSIGLYLADFFGGILGIFNLQSYISLLNPFGFLPPLLSGIIVIAIPIVIALRVIGRDN